MNIHELIEASGVPLKTIRHYIAEGLLVRPENHGVNTRYDDAFFRRLLAVKKLKSEGVYRLRDLRARLEPMSDDQLRELVEGPLPKPAEVVETAPADGEAWRRFVLVPGLELIIREGSPPLVHRLASEIYATYRGR